MGAVGLQTHIWNNNIKSVLLLALFPVLLALMLYGLVVGWVGMTGVPYDVRAERGDGLGGELAYALEVWRGMWYWAFLAAGAWFAIAWAFHTRIISAAVGAQSLTRKEAPKLYNMLENLCISRGMAMPKLMVVENDALNAFASGIDERTYQVTLTRGLIDRLDDDEIEAVIAHELSHIMHKDVRLLMVAVIFVGIFSFVAEGLFRAMMRGGLRRTTLPRGRRGNSRGGGGMILIAIVLIAVAYGLAMLIRFQLSQRREFMADAGAVDLTRNPDAMIRALQKISGRADLEAPSEVRQMYIENTAKFAGVFATHPPIKTRIRALVEHAGGNAAPEPPEGPWARV